MFEIAGDYTKIEVNFKHMEDEVKEKSPRSPKDKS